MLEPSTKHTVTPDRGKEFTNHLRIPMDYYENIFPKGVIDIY